MKNYKCGDTMNLVLIGMSGAGKSTLGILLAKSLGMDFIDTDIIIQHKTGRLLQDIINNAGIDSFLKIEENIIIDLAAANCVIATGGSVIYSKKSMESLKRNGRIIYLHVPYEEIEQRIKDIISRGIVLRNGSSLKDTYNERIPLYIKYSDIVIDCSNKRIEECLNEILKKL
jgi:shikimate kinase